MNRAELIIRLAGQHPQIPERGIALAVKAILEAFSSTLSHGDRVEIRHFGSFSTKRLPQRVGRNPKTGESVNVPVRFVPHFKPGGALRSCVMRAGHERQSHAAKRMP